METQDKSAFISAENADQFIHWLFNIVRPYVKGRTLEIGSGQSSIHDLFIENNLPIHLSDRDENTCEMLHQYYNELDSIRAIHQIHLDQSEISEKYNYIRGVFDTVLLLNTLQILPLDPLIILNAKHLLRRRGHLIVLASASTALYGAADQDWNNIKVNDRPSLNRMFNNDYEIMKTIYFSSQISSCLVPVIPSIILIARKR
jgi:hypothetical protein